MEDEGREARVPAGSKIEAGGHLVVCKSAKEFKRVYGLDTGGEFEGTLSHGGGTVELFDAAGKRIDGLKYKTRAP